MLDRVEGPLIEGDGPTKAKTYSEPVPGTSPQSTPADACSLSAKGLRQPVWTDSGDGWKNYSHEFDPKRLVLVALTSSSLPLGGDDLSEFTFQQMAQKPRSGRSPPISRPFEGTNSGG